MMNRFRELAYPHDWLIVGFSTLMALLIAIFGEPFGKHFSPFVFHLIAILIAITITLQVDENRNRWFALIRILYPAFMFAFYYTMMGKVIFLFFDQFYDWQLVAFEKAVFGVNPTIYIDQHLLNVPLNELLSFSYFTYYLMGPAFLTPLFLLKKDRALKKTIAAICATFFVSYLLFFLYPIEGPRWFFANDYLHKIEGPVFRPMVNYVIDNGAFHGGAMPSTHVAAALVLLFSAFRYLRPFAWVLLPLNIGLAIGTFWGRFHYVSDVFVGAAIMLVCTWYIWKNFDKWVPQNRGEPERIKRQIDRVS